MPKPCPAVGVRPGAHRRPWRPRRGAFTGPHPGPGDDDLPLADILHWRKSTYSGDGWHCVEIDPAPHAVHICDSKHTTGPRLTVTSTTWARVVFLTVRRPCSQ
ncbi:DUF397 domain-containing protein [Streptomyces shenzhenensis]|uniref:DUF397 domain-containing protein n=1 Tax=Streptomyces shenzhenensis TaxID=943815 RepID=UPI0015F118B7|nr:DUF397 domain-containing protein [Streptomyces shenzhenensis]